MTTPAVLSASLWRIVEKNLSDLMAAGVSAPRPPKTFGGHLVRDDALADLAYVCGLLIAGGTDQLLGLDLRACAEDLILALRPEEVESFSSYRIAEATLMLGGLSALGAEASRRAAVASHSGRLIDEVAAGGSSLRPNFAVVAARCIDAEACLTGCPPDLAARTALARAAEPFACTTTGWLNDGRGEEVHFDIYTPEMYLLAEPFRGALLPSWAAGLQRVLADLQALTLDNGAIAWGRSIGPLALAMTLELAALAQESADDGARAWWLAAASEAAKDLEGWFLGGVVTANRTSATDVYRGPPRHLQLTFDLLGKVAWSALRLSRSPHALSPHSDRRLLSLDRFVSFGRGAAAWAYHAPGMSFTLPLLSGNSVDYVGSPRAPGLFEQPVGAIPLLVPTITTAGPGRTSIHHVPGGLPTATHRACGCLDVAHGRWVTTDPAVESRVTGSRHASYKVTGRRLTVRERLTINDAPPEAALTINVGEVEGRPLTTRCASQLSRVSIETSGHPEWRTHWGEIARLRELTLPLVRGTTCEFTWSVEPHIVVATTEPTHQYSRSLYDSMTDVVVRPAGPPDEDLARRLRDVDILHVAWPERWVGVERDATMRTIERIRQAGTRIVWTQHNLRPHKFRTPDGDSAYQCWAAAADGVIHHSAYGRDLARRMLPYSHARHFVIPHGHWGRFFPAVRPPRAQVEAEEGWPPASIRLAIIGQPRREKTLQAAVDAVHESERDDLQLVARLSRDVRLPADSRVIASYGHLDVKRYYRRLTAVDAVILPFVGDTMVTTGTVFDCIGGGIATIATPWGFLRETLGDRAITYDGSRRGLKVCLERLTPSALSVAGHAVKSLQPAHEWATAARLTVDAFETVCGGS